jgi:hypothetical protein
MLKLHYQILDKRAKSKIKTMNDESEDIEYVLEERRDVSNWNPTDDDIPELVESIKFWDNLIQVKRRTGITDKVMKAAQLKKNILLDCLSRTPNMSEFMKVINCEKP